jgi:hypothetical protein
MSKTLTDSAPPGRKDVVSFFWAFSNLPESDEADPARKIASSRTIHLPRRPAG